MGARLGGLERSHPGRGHAGGSSGVVGAQMWRGTDWMAGPAVLTLPMGLCVAEHVVLTLPVGLDVAGHVVLTLHGTGCGWARSPDSPRGTGCGWAHGPDSPRGTGCG